MAYDNVLAAVFWAIYTHQPTFENTNVVFIFLVGWQNNFEKIKKRLLLLAYVIQMIYICSVVKLLIF
jgi:hypothetical protein